MGELADALRRSQRGFLEGVIEFLSRRLAAALVTLFLATIVVFAVVEVLPGDPALVMLGTDARPDTLAALRAKYAGDVGAGDIILEVPGTPLYAVIYRGRFYPPPWRAMVWQYGTRTSLHVGTASITVNGTTQVVP